MAKVKPCEGVGFCFEVYFRGKASTYITAKNEVLIRTRLVPLKRMSCPRCMEYFIEQLSEALASHPMAYFHDFEEVEDGALYSGGIFNTETDQYGYVDDYDVGFAKVEED